MSEPWDEDVSLDWLRSFLIYGYRRQLIERNWVGWGRPRRILEAGSGPAHDSLTLAERGGRVTAVDLSQTGLRAARRIYAQRGFPVQVSCADILSLPFADGQFDLTWNAGTLEHFPADDDVQRVLAEMARCTRPGGTVLVLAPNRRYFWYQWHLARMRRRHLERQYTFERSFRIGEMEAWFRQVGLCDVHSSGVHIHPSPEFILPHTGRLTAMLRALFAPIEQSPDSRWKGIAGLDIAVWGKRP